VNPDQKIDYSHHAYQRDPQSGAGNCICGAAEEHRRHPHDFRRAWNPLRPTQNEYCVCGRLPEDKIHLAGFTSSGSGIETEDDVVVDRQVLSTRTFDAPLSRGADHG